MNDNDIRTGLPEIVLRIPGRWEHPDDLACALPDGYKLGPYGLIMPDGSTVAMAVLPADEEFPALFASACHRPPSDRDREIIENYTVNVCLMGPGGSLPAARRMLEAGAAVVRAGGGGVFVDNSVLAHGSDDWLALADDPENAESGDWGGVYWAFVATIGDEKKVWSVGMHVLGFRDAVLPRSGDDDADHFTLNNFLAYTYRSGVAIADGDILGDDCATPSGTFRLRHELATRFAPDSPLHNPYGQWRLEPVGIG